MPSESEAGNGGEQQDYKAGQHPDNAAPSTISAPRAKAENAPPQGCTGTPDPKLPCDAVAAQATLQQARYAYWQAWTGVAQAIGLVASLLFSALATRAAFGAVREAEKGAQASREAVEEARNANEISRASIDRYIKAERGALGFQSLFGKDVDGTPFLQVSVNNAGRSWVIVKWADMLFMDNDRFCEMKVPIPIHLAGRSIDWSKTGVPSGQGWNMAKFRLTDDVRYLVGGVIYEDAMEEVSYLPIAYAVFQDRTLRRFEGDFSLWDAKVAEMRAKIAKNS